MSNVQVDTLTPNDKTITANVKELGSAMVAGSVAAWGATAVDASVEFVRTAGYYSPGDGGAASYRRVSTMPDHPGRLQMSDGSWWEFAEGSINLFQAGAVGDSISGSTGTGTDDTAAIRRAIAIATALGIDIVIPGLPAGAAFRTTGTLVCANPVTFRGIGYYVTAYNTEVNTPLGGSWLYLDHSGEGFYCRDDASVGSSKKSVKLIDFGIDRNQDAPGAGWVPRDTGWDVRVEFNAEFNNIMFLKSSRIALIRSAGQLQTTAVRGQPLIVGYKCERSSDVQRWVGDHFWPYWSQDINVKTYTVTNTDCVQVQRADGLDIDNMFGIWYRRVFYAVDAAGAGSGLAGFNLRNLYADIGGGGIEIVSNYYSAYGSIENYLCNSDVGGTPSEGAAFRLSGTVPSQIKLSMRSNRSPAEAVYVSGSSHQVTLTASRIAGWGYVLTDRYAIRATDGAVITNLHMPLFSGGSLRYSQENSGQIILPVIYQLGASAASGGGFHSTRITIADDNVAVVQAPVGNKTANMHITPASVPGAGNPAGAIWLRATSSPSAAPINLTHTDNVTVGTGVYTGTTGIDGNISFSAAADGNFYIENRTGASRSFDITLLGS